MKDAIWGSLKITASFNNEVACLTLKGDEHYINLYNSKILFEDRKNIFLTSTKVIPATRCLNNNDNI